MRAHERMNAFPMKTSHARAFGARFPKLLRDIGFAGLFATRKRFGEQMAHFSNGGRSNCPACHAAWQNACKINA